VTTILLIRHAENDFLKKNRLACRLPGVHLNDDGAAHARALAEALAPRLKDVQLKGLYSSPMERAQETAQPLAETLGLPVMIRAGLNETDCGTWAGKTVKSLSRLKAWKTVQQTPAQFRFPDGESFTEIQERIVAELDALAAEHADPKDVVLCFSHADPIKLAVAHYLGMSLDTFQRLVISPTSITTLQLEKDTSRLLGLNVAAFF